MRKRYLLPLCCRLKIAIINLINPLKEIKLNEIRFMVSCDDAIYLEYLHKEPIPNNEAPDEWNAGERIFFNEAKMPKELLDERENWNSTHFYLKLFYIPTNELMYHTHIVLEDQL